jgi:serine/threonine protein kinase
MPGDPFGLIGHAIDGQFHVLEVAGEGGFSVVYRGQHLTLREPIAIKCLKFQSKSKNPQVIAQFTQRFFDESRIMYRLSQGNLNIVRAITTGVTMAPTTGETVPYMVLEWLEGKSMSAELKERRQKKLPPKKLAQVIEEFEPAALALAYAHSQGVVHRDIKPGNLFLQNTREGARMKVLDFGMAKVLSPEAMGGLESAETLGGVMVMSPQYVTPEQLEKSHGTIGAWTDVYSFALIVVEALTNKRAREAESMTDLMIQITRDPPPTPMRRGAIVSSAVEMVFERALKRDAKSRYPDAGAFWTDLKRAAAQVDEDPVDMATNVDMKLPAELLKGTLAIPSKPAEPKPDFSKTMPLTQRTSAPPAQPKQRPFAGTVPMQAVPEVAAARVAALEAARPSVPQPATSSQPLPAQSYSPPSPSVAIPPPRASTPTPAPPSPPISSPAVASGPRSKPKPQPVVVAKRKSRPVLVAFLLLFILASVAMSTLLLVRLYVR